MAEETKPEAEKPEAAPPKEENKAAAEEAVVVEAPKPKAPMEKKPEVVFIGNKPPMSYVMAVITAMSSGLNEITLKARGKAITTAVDVAEITTNRFMKDLKVTAIGIGTEEMPPREGDNRARMVSTMEIKLKK
jgi:archaea-specific DNA-binding protein